MTFNSRDDLRRSDQTVSLVAAPFSALQRVALLLTHSIGNAYFSSERTSCTSASVLTLCGLASLQTGVVSTNVIVPNLDNIKKRRMVNQGIPRKSSTSYILSLSVLLMYFRVPT
jgi:hypothetical protein